MYGMSCYPLITKSTHYGKSLNSLIYNIFTNSKFIPIDNGIIINDISDHLPIYTIYNSYKAVTTNDKKFKCIRQLHDKNIIKYKESILKYNWNYIYSNTDLNILFDTFMHDIEKLFNETCPVIKIKIKLKKINLGLVKV